MPAESCTFYLGGGAWALEHTMVKFLQAKLYAKREEPFLAWLVDVQSDTEEAAKMGNDARKHVQQEFSRPAFGRKLVQSMERMLSS